MEPDKVLSELNECGNVWANKGERNSGENMGAGEQIAGSGTESA